MLCNRTLKVLINMEIFMYLYLWPNRAGKMESEHRRSMIRICFEGDFIWFFTLDVMNQKHKTKNIPQHVPHSSSFRVGVRVNSYITSAATFHQVQLFVGCVSNQLLQNVLLCIFSSLEILSFFFKSIQRSQS